MSFFVFPNAVCLYVLMHFRKVPYKAFKFFIACLIISLGIEMLAIWMKMYLYNDDHSTNLITEYLSTPLLWIPKLVLLIVSIILVSVDKSENN